MLAHACSSCGWLELVHLRCYPQLASPTATPHGSNHGRPGAGKPLAKHHVTARPRPMPPPLHTHEHTQTRTGRCCWRTGWAWPMCLTLSGPPCTTGCACGAPTSTRCVCHIQHGVTEWPCCCVLAHNRRSAAAYAVLRRPEPASGGPRTRHAWSSDVCTHDMHRSRGGCTAWRSTPATPPLWASAWTAARKRRRRTQTCGS
jgi:hypothetical protein